MNIKKDLYLHCEQFLNDRFKTVKGTIEDIQNALQSETKSTAGDKHETGRAMLQLEREKAGKQLAELQKLKTLLSKINVDSVHKQVALGSAVFTSQFNYFISISTGEIELKSGKFYAISPSTPIAKLLLSKTIGDTIVFRDHAITIMDLQ